MSTICNHDQCLVNETIHAAFNNLCLHAFENMHHLQHDKGDN